MDSSQVRPPRKGFDPSATLATPATAEAVRLDLETQLNALGADNDDAAAFAYTESKAIYDLMRDRFKALDGKAVAVVGIVTSGLGAIAIVGDSARVGHGPWLISALVALCLALVAALVSLAPRDVVTTDLSPYVYPATLANRDNFARVRVALARAWLRDAATLEYAMVPKGLLLRVATTLVVAGVVGLVINFVRMPTSDTSTLRVIVASPSPFPAPPRAGDAER